MTDHDKKVIRFACIGLIAYLAIFYGRGAFSGLEAKRAAYMNARNEAKEFHKKLKPYETQLLLLEKLRKDRQINLEELNSDTLVADASTAIQIAANQCGVALGPLQETPSRGDASTLTMFRLSGEGPIDGVVNLIYTLRRIGFPLIIDSLNLDGGEFGGDTQKFDLELRIIDYNNWQPQTGGARGS